MSEVVMTSDITVKLVRAMASDDMVVQAAQVSAKGENKPETVPKRLIEALMQGRHGSPFEHNAFTFFVEAPIFVFREWHRHRISSYNEMSGRYTELLPRFYTPAEDRALTNVGTKMKPNFVPGSGMQQAAVANLNKEIAEDAWRKYQFLLKYGVANEIARTVLPVSIMSQMYWTVNARSLMNFLSLRGDQEGALVVSYPQREIQIAAEQVEKIFAEHMPLTHEVWVRSGRVAP